MTDSEQKKGIGTHIRWMIRRDLCEVLQIENDCFGASAWQEKDFMRCLRQTGCTGMVAEHQGHIVGYKLFEIHRTKFDLINFAVAKEVRRKGIGTQLLARLIGKLDMQRQDIILLKVRETNLGALIFFRENEFKAIDILHSYYEDTDEDVYLMRYSLAESRQQAQKLLSEIQQNKNPK